MPFGSSIVAVADRLPLSNRRRGDRLMQILAEAEDLPKTANIKTQLISLWTAPVFGVVLLVAFLAFPGFFPPMSPEMTAEQVAKFYSDHTAAVTGATLFALADIFYLVAAFRPARNPELIELLNDMGWMIFIAPVGAAVAMNLLLGLAIYFDDGP